MAIISVDFFGNLNKDQDFWQELLKYARIEGIKVHIISGLWPKELDEKLEYQGYIKKVHYDHTESILSYLNGKGFDTWFDENHDSWYTHSAEWWRAKAKMCEEIGVRIHFDSDNRFRPEFRKVSTRFICTSFADEKSLVKSWHHELKLANTFDDEYLDEYAYMGLGTPIVPM